MLYIGIGVLAGIALLGGFFLGWRKRPECHFGNPGCDGTRCYQCRRSAGE